MSEHKHEHGDACGRGHDHDHDHEHEEFVLTLTDEEGKEVEMVLVGHLMSARSFTRFCLNAKIRKRTASFYVWKKRTRKWFFTILRTKKNGMK